MAEPRFFIQYEGDTVSLIPFWEDSGKQNRMTIAEWDENELVERRSEANSYTTEELEEDDSADEVSESTFLQVYDDIDSADRFGAHPPKPPRPPQA